MYPNQLIHLIYRSAMQQGVFIDLMRQLSAVAHEDDHGQLNEDELLSHFDQSAAISERMAQLQHRQTVAENVINQLNTGVILLDADGRVLFANPQSRLLLENNSDMQLREQQLSFHNNEKQRDLLKTLQTWSEDQSACSQAMLVSNSDDEQHVMLLSPATEAYELLSLHLPEAATAALFIARPAESTSDQVAERLQHLYQLTPAESDITCRLACGQTVDEIAEARNSKAGTIRTYIKSIMNKTGTNRQAELIALVLRAPLQVSLQKSQVIDIEGSEHNIQLPNGKDIAFRSYGPKNGKVIVSCHCSLSCRFETPMDISALYQHGIRLIVPDRAGIGLSNGTVYEDLSGFGADLKALLKHLGLKKVKLIGTVAGGAHALATAYHYPELVDELLLLDAFAPGVREHKVPDAPLYYRMLPRLSQRFPRVTEKLMRIVMQEFSNDWEKTYNHLSKLFNESDARVLLQDDVRQRGIKLAMECTRQNPQALVRDMILVHGDWGIELSAISHRCHIVHGNADPVAAAYAEHLSTQLPNNQLHFRDGEGFAAMLFLNLFEIMEGAGWIKPAGRLKLSGLSTRASADALS